MLTIKTQARHILEHNILPFWMENMTDHENGGYYGRIDGNNRLHAHADKGAVLNARILWAFAAAYRVLRNPQYLQAAVRAKQYIMDHFVDHLHGGVYWALDYKGNPIDTKKQSYAIGFTIYAMSEFYRATGDAEALRCATELYTTLQQHAYDATGTGYIEALTRDWQPIADMRLSDKDENMSRTMNTHLHILEPYTNLYRCLTQASTLNSQFPINFVDFCHDSAKQASLMALAAPKVLNSPFSILHPLRSSLTTLIHIFTQKLLNPHTHHLDLFFDQHWQGRRNIESYGHDIEAAWLLTEALEVLQDSQLTAQTMPKVQLIAQAAEEGIMADGSMIHEKKDGIADDERHWWVQCECVIGEINQYQHFNDRQALERALRCFQYIEDNLVDRQHGEWYWSRRADGTVNHQDDKAGFWKCPYHNTRMCLEIIERHL